MVEMLSIEGLAGVVRNFTPQRLSKEQSALNVVDRVYLYIVSKLWANTGLVQEISSSYLTKMFNLTSPELVQAQDAFDALQLLKDPWVKDNAQIDGAWEQKICDIIQTETLGLVLFGCILKNIRNSIQSRLGISMGAHSILEIKIKQLQTSTQEELLEQRLLLKEFCVGRRSEEFPVWQGLVSNSTPRRKDAGEKRRMHFQMLFGELGGFGYDTCAAFGNYNHNGVTPLGCDEFFPPPQIYKDLRANAKGCGPTKVQFVEEEPPGAYPFGYHNSRDSQNGAPFWNEVNPGNPRYGVAGW